MGTFGGDQRDTAEPCRSHCTQRLCGPMGHIPPAQWVLTPLSPTGDGGQRVGKHHRAPVVPSWHHPPAGRDGHKQDPATPGFGQTLKLREQFPAGISSRDAAGGNGTQRGCPGRCRCQTKATRTSAGPQGWERARERARERLRNPKPGSSLPQAAPGSPPCFPGLETCVKLKLRWM